MTRGVNKVIIVGNLGQDPEMKYMPSGNAVTNVSVATSEQWKDKQTGQPQERTEWHRIVFFNRLAEIAAEYLRKGSKVYVEGSLRTRKWQAQDGSDRYTTEIVASEMQMLDSRGDQQQGGYDYNQDHQYAQQPQPAPQQRAPQPQRAAPPPPNQPMGAHNAGQAPQQSYQPHPNAGYAGVPSDAYQNQRPPAPQQAPQPAAGFDNFDDDIPF